MEEISHPPPLKKRKLIVKASERMVPFNKIRKRYLPKKLDEPKADIRNYFSSTQVEQTAIKYNDTALNGLVNGENVNTKIDVIQKPRLEVSYPTYEEITIRKPKQRSKSTSFRNSSPKKTHKINENVLANGDNCSHDDTVLRSVNVNGHVDVVENMTIRHPNTTAISEDIKESPNKSKSIGSLDNKTNVSYNSRTLSESSLFINGCELKPYLTPQLKLKRIDPMLYKCTSAYSSPTYSKVKVKSRKARSFGLNESWITKKSKIRESNNHARKHSKIVPPEKEKREIFDRPFEVETIVDYSWCKQTVS